MTNTNGNTSPKPTNGQVEGRLLACMYNMHKPVMLNISAATENTSRNQLQAVPVIADIQIERESTLSPSVDARLVLIFYVRGDQV